MSVRLKLTLSYAGFLLVAGAMLLAAVAVFLLRYVPDGPIYTEIGWAPNRSDLLRAFAPAATAVLVFLLVLGLVGGWFFAGRMLAPLARIGDAARLAASGSLSHRIALPGPRDEFRELADVFDTMLERLEAHVVEQRRFAANASHELRTPLAITQTLLDVGRADAERDVDALLQRLRDVNARAIALTEALLTLARADGRAFEREAVDLSLLAEEAAETLLPLAHERGVEVSVSGAPAFTHGSAALLQQLVTNLVHNAVVHNLPGGGIVGIRTETQGEASVLVVENSGAMLSADTVATLVEPFQRGAERTRGGGHEGTGLGLAIAEAIVRAHAGTLSLAPRDGGGLVVTVALLPG